MQALTRKETLETEITTALKWEKLVQELLDFLECKEKELRLEHEELSEELSEDEEVNNNAMHAYCCVINNYLLSFRIFIVNN